VGASCDRRRAKLKARDLMLRRVGRAPRVPGLMTCSGVASRSNIPPPRALLPHALTHFRIASGSRFQISIVTPPLGLPQGRGGGASWTRLPHDACVLANRLEMSSARRSRSFDDAPPVLTFNLLFCNNCDLLSMEEKPRREGGVLCCMPRSSTADCCNVVINK